MIKEALQYVIGLGTAKTEILNDQIYSTQPMHLIEEPISKAINVRSLSGLVEYLHSEFDGVASLMVHVVSPTEVVAFTTYNNDKRRNFAIQATAMLPDIKIGSWCDVEDFIIKLQSCFVETEDRALMLKVVGNLKEENVNSFGDNGVTQSVVAKAGVANVDNVIVPNPVTLKPFRTFVEITQPESEFIFRMQSGPKCALFEADGGTWKLAAMLGIKLFLEEELKTEIEDGRITIIS